MQPAVCDEQVTGKHSPVTSCGILLFDGCQMSSLGAKGGDRCRVLKMSGIAASFDIHFTFGIFVVFVQELSQV